MSLRTGTLAILLVVVARGIDARLELAIALSAAAVVIVASAISLHGAGDVLDTLAPTLGSSRRSSSSLKSRDPLALFGAMKG